ncbi:DapH/DapD/GlmU-related protein [Brevundimonas sp. FT23028]|uniref:DapH/DapD/GlmU-related protein n=1 Tax=Brevundimonas sp. FT23028 TaxID=3393748 RepID=UPI003B58901A
MIHLIGAGGHGKVVIDAWLAAGGERADLRIRDGRDALAGQTLMGCPVSAPEIDGTLAGARVHVAVGDNRVRAALLSDARAVGAVPVTVVHPHASVSAFATIGDGSFIGAGAVVGPDTVLGAGVIVCAGAVVDHDCRLGDHAFIGPGAVVGPRLSIGARAAVKTGVVVTRDLQADEIRPTPSPPPPAAGLHTA